MASENIKIGDICTYSYDTKNKSLSIVEVVKELSDEVVEVKFHQVIVDDSGNDYFTYLLKSGYTMNVSRKYLHRIEFIARKQARNEQLRDDLQKHMDAEEYLAKLTDEQQAEIERLENKLAIAKEGLKHTCITCFYMETPSQEMPCRDCQSFNKWKWRGDEDDSE